MKHKYNIIILISLLLFSCINSNNNTTREDVISINQQKLIDEGRVNYVCPSDYRDGSELDSIVKLILQRMALTNELESIRIEQELERKTPTLVPAEIE